MRLALRCLVMALSCWAMTGAAAAQDALRHGADFSDDWDAILKATPPQNMVAAEPRKRTREGASEERESRRAARSGASVERAHDSRAAREKTEPERPRERGERARDRLARAERAPAEQVDTSPRRAARPERIESTGSTSSQEGESVARRSLEAGGYESLKRAWHEPWPDERAQVVATKTGSAPALSIHPDGKLTAPFVLLPQGPDGGFDEAQIEVASKAFGSWKGGPKVSARLLDLIYHAAKHFGVYHVHLVSGVRNDRSGSRHSHGLAADIVLPGVEDDELAAYFRPQGFVGVGVYTRGGFVHVDVRERSYFWLDKSPPGRRMKIIPERADEAKAADEAALARGQTGYVNPPRLQKALHARFKRRLAQARSAQ